MLIKDGKISVINGLRGFAVLAVIYQHTIYSWLQKHFDIQYIIGNGWLGVNLFFILSGFVLYKPYFLHQREFTTAQSWLEFYRHRIKRLYPLFLASLLVALVIHGFTTQNIVLAIKALSTLALFNEADFFPAINVVLWSLEVEIWFSILFPCLVLLVIRFGITKVFYAVLLVALILRIPGSINDQLGVHLNYLKDNFITRIDDFVLGMFICDQYYRGVYEKLKPHIVYIIASLSILALGSYLWDLRKIGVLPTYFSAVLNNVIQLGFYLLIAGSLTSGSFLEKVFSWRTLQLLGLMCFSLYLWHVLFVDLLLYPRTYLNFAIYFVTTFLFSALTYRFIEFRTQPFRKLFLLDSISK